MVFQDGLCFSKQMCNTVSGSWGRALKIDGRRSAFSLILLHSVHSISRPFPFLWQFGLLSVSCLNDLCRIFMRSRDRTMASSRPRRRGLKGELGLRKEPPEMITILFEMADSDWLKWWIGNVIGNCIGGDQNAPLSNHNTRSPSSPLSYILKC